MSRSPGLTKIAFEVIEGEVRQAQRSEDWLESLAGIPGSDYTADAIDDTIDYILDKMRERFSSGG